MRIWIINHYAIPPSSTGGTRHYNLARQLQKKGHEVLLIAANFNHLTRTHLAGKTDCYPEIIEGVPFLWLSVPSYQGNSFSRFWNMLAFRRAIIKNKFLLKSKKPDVIIGSSPHLFAALGAKQLAKKRKIPFVLEIRDIWPDSLVDLGRYTHRHPLIKIMKLIEQHLYQHAQKIISLLPMAQNYLEKLDVDPKKNFWLPNAIDPHLIPVLSPNPVTEKFIVMSAGAHGLANDLDTVLDAAKLLQQQNLTHKIEIRLIGEGPEKPRLQQRAQTEKITIVKFLDAVPKSEIYHTLNQANVFLMLLKKSPVFRWGVSPNKLFDYLMMAKPIIFGIDTTYNPIQMYQAGITIEASNPENLANAIKTLANTDKTELDAMGQRGKAYVLAQHDVNKLVDGLEKLLLETIA